MSTLVIGGTGKTGAPIVRGLRERGIEAFSASRAGDRRFDWHDSATHDAVLAGIDRLYAISPLADERPQDRMIPFFERALALGVRRIVLLSSSAVDESMPGLGEVDRWLRGHAPEWTVLRPSWFMQNFFDPSQMRAKTMAEEGILYSATGDGRVPFVDVADIAAVGVCALADEKAHNTAHHITGPEALSYDDVAKMLGVRHASLTADAFAALLVKHGMPEAYAQLLASLDLRIASGMEATVTDTVLRVTGRPPRSFVAYVRSLRGGI
jgi:uncharacterized protein YbjT (DUF2867 family)